MEPVAARGRECGGIPSCGSYVHDEASNHSLPHHSISQHSKGRAAMLWGIGSTVLSVLGFLGWGVFEQYNSSLAELRADLKHFNEASSLFVKKDTLTRIREQTKSQFTEIQSMSASNKHLEVELKASEKARDEVCQELIRIRERLAFVEGRQSVTPNVRENASATRDAHLGAKPDAYPTLAPQQMSHEE